MNRLEAKFPRGTCPVHAFGPDDRQAPVVLFFPDAFGPRPASFAVAEELAAEGWRVLMLDQFYEHIPYEPLTPKSLFEQGPERDRVMTMLRSVTMAKVDEDVAASLALASEHSAPDAPFAAIGYCMGGRYALAAVTASPRVRFAGAFHASNIARQRATARTCALPRPRAGSILASPGSTPPMARRSTAASPRRCAKPIPTM